MLIKSSKSFVHLNNSDYDEQRISMFSLEIF